MELCMRMRPAHVWCLTFSDLCTKLRYRRVHAVIADWNRHRRSGALDFYWVSLSLVHVHAPLRTIRVSYSHPSLTLPQ